MTRSCCWGGLRSASSVASSWFAPQTSSWCPGAALCGSGLHSWCPVMQPRTLSLISLSLFLCVWVIVGYVMVWFLLDKWLVWLCLTWLETDFASIRVQVSPLAVQFIFEKCYPLRLTLLMHSAASIHPFFNVLQIPEIPDCWVKMKSLCCSSFYVSLSALHCVVNLLVSPDLNEALGSAHYDSLLCLQIICKETQKINGTREKIGTQEKYVR